MEIVYFATDLSEVPTIGLLGIEVQQSLELTRLKYKGNTRQAVSDRSMGLSFIIPKQETKKYLDEIEDFFDCKSAISLIFIAL